MSSQVDLDHSPVTDADVTRCTTALMMARRVVKVVGSHLIRQVVV